MILDGDFVVLDERLLQQADLLEVLTDATHDDLLDDGVGLLGVLRIFLGLSQADLLLLGDELLGDVALVHVGRVQSRDLHGDVLAELDDSSVGGLGLEVDEHGDTAAHVDIGDAQAGVVAREAADLDVLADDEHLVVLLLEHGLAVAVSAGVQRVEISRVFLGDDGSDALDILHEQVILGHEVGLGIDLDDHADAVNVNGVSHALGGDAAGLFLSSGEALFPEPFHGFIDIAIGSGQSLFAVHHADAGHFTQIFHISSRKCHNSFSFIVFIRRAGTRPALTVSDYSSTF